MLWGKRRYGSYTYTYESGHSGDVCLVGFAVRGKGLVVCLTADTPGQPELLAKLGRHRMGKVCLYFNRLADLDVSVLEDRATSDGQIVATSARDRSRASMVLAILSAWRIS